MTELIKRKELLVKLIDKAADEKEVKELQKQLEEVIEEIARKKVETEIAEKAKKEAEEKAAAELVEKNKKAVTIEVGTIGDYKGVNLRKAVAMAQNMKPSKTLENPEVAERLAKTFTDFMLAGRSRPGVELKANELIVGTDAQGGYAVPTVENMEILGYIKEQSLALQDCTVVPMTSDKTTWPAEDTTALVYVRDEIGSVTQATPTLRQVSLVTKNFDAFVYTSKEMTADSPTIVGMLLAQFQEAVGKKVDSAVFISDGTDVGASGVFKAAGFSTIMETGSSAFSMLSESHIRSLIAQIPPERLGNSKFYVHHDPLWKYVRGLRDAGATGGYLFNESKMGAAAPPTIWGYPVRSSSQMPSTSAPSTGMMVFGDLKGFYIGERLSNISLLFDPYGSAANGMDRWFLYTRWGFAQALPKNFTRLVTAS